MNIRSEMKGNEKRQRRDEIQVMVKRLKLASNCEIRYYFNIQGKTTYSYFGVISDDYSILLFYYFSSLTIK